MLADQLDRLEWFRLPDGKIGFRGRLGGYQRQVIGNNRDKLMELAIRMAAGIA